MSSELATIRDIDLALFTLLSTAFGEDFPFFGEAVEVFVEKPGIPEVAHPKYPSVAIRFLSDVPDSEPGRNEGHDVVDAVGNPIEEVPPEDPEGDPTQYELYDVQPEWRRALYAIDSYAKNSADQDREFLNRITRLFPRRNCVLPLLHLPGHRILTVIPIGGVVNADTDDGEDSLLHKVWQFEVLYGLDLSGHDITSRIPQYYVDEEGVVDPGKVVPSEIVQPPPSVGTPTGDAEWQGLGRPLQDVARAVIARHVYWRPVWNMAGAPLTTRVRGKDILIDGE